MQIIYEDNHIIIVSKVTGEIVQGDKTGDEPLSETLKTWLKEKYNKPGNVFVGVVHRLDRPVEGLVAFAKTSKALSRLNEMFRQGKVHKRYWALVRNCPVKPEDQLKGYITTIERSNKSFVHTQPVPASKEARLNYKVLGKSDTFTLLEVELLTGRKHQIRAQLAAIGSPIRGDLKYGDRRSNPNGGISLLAHEIEFTHPVSGKKIHVFAPLPQDAPWRSFDDLHNSIVEKAQDNDSKSDNTDNQP